MEEEAKHRQADKQQLERANATLQFLRQLTLVDAKPHPEEGATAFSCSCKNPNDKRGTVLQLLLLLHESQANAQCPHLHVLPSPTALAFVLTMTEDAVEYKPIEIVRLPPLTVVCSSRTNN